MTVFFRTILLAVVGVAAAIIIGFSLQDSHAAVSRQTPPQSALAATTSAPTVVMATSTAGAVATTTSQKPPIKVAKAPTGNTIPAKTASTPPPPPAAEASTPVSTGGPTAAPSEPAYSESALNDKVRQSVVNILCISAGGKPVNSISGSGVIIDSRGVILTNAHVAQYFLLKNYPTPNNDDCTIRIGSPAKAAYKAELLFIPPAWITANASEIIAANPSGNGEHDYAFLRITGPADPSVSMPDSFPFLPISVNPPDTGYSLLTAGYPAGFLGGSTILQNLYASSAETTVGDLYTFGSGTIDAFSVGGSIVAQPGASGGAVVDGNGVLVGIVVTSSTGDTTSARDLHALATSYIINDFDTQAGGPLQAYLTGDLASRAVAFENSFAPDLRQALVNAIEGR